MTHWTSKAEFVGSKSLSGTLLYDYVNDVLSENNLGKQDLLHISMFFIIKNILNSFYHMSSSKNKFLEKYYKLHMTSK